MTQTIPKLISDIDKYFQYESSKNPTTQDDLQAFMKNEHGVMACLVKKLWQPETMYTKGQIIESPNMPVGFSAVALTTGTSYSNEPDWGDSAEDVTDGSIKWRLTKGNVTVNGVSPDENGNITISKVNSASNADNATKATKDSAEQQISSTYIKSISGDSNSLTITKGNGSTIKVNLGATTPNTNFTVTSSTQLEKTLSVDTSYSKSNTIDKDLTSGSGNISDIYKTIVVSPGISGGNYSLKQLLQNLVNLSHSHIITQTGSRYNCNCKCTCDCSDTDST